MDSTPAHAGASPGHDCRASAIVIGVTGHRDLRPEDMPTLEGSVRRILDEVRDAHPHTPLLLLSPLAEGSDRLVARVALDLGVRLVVPLPLAAGAVQAGLRERAVARGVQAPARGGGELLRAAAHGRLTARRHPGSTETSGTASTRRSARSSRKQSQVFLALWDGVTGSGHATRWAAPRTSSGSGWKAFRRATSRPAASPLSFSSSGPVYHIVTPRVGQPVPRPGADPHAAAADPSDGGVVRRAAGLDGPVQRRRVAFPRVRWRPAARPARRNCCRWARRRSPTPSLRCRTRRG